MTTLEVLIAARALIADETKWCRGTWARSATGASVFEESPKACQWCAGGAVNKVAGSFVNGNAARRALDLAAGDLFFNDVNDEQGHAATLAMFDRAIASEQAKHDAGKT